MEGTEVKAAAVDIGTNSMRLLIVRKVGDDTVELGRWERITGLGRGVDATGLLGADAIDRTLLALAEFGGRMSEHEVDVRRAVATSASRDASNREEFFNLAEVALGVRPDLVSGEEEAKLSFEGATSGLPWPGPFLVIDIGGGSTEFVAAEGGRSFDMGSVRLSDRLLPERPPTQEALTVARAAAAAAFVAVSPIEGRVIGVAGTWTSLGAIMLGRSETHLTEFAASDVTETIDLLAGLSVEATAALPGLNPARAPVILAGAVVAEAALAALSASTVTVSERDLLDGLAASLLA